MKIWPEQTMLLHENMRKAKLCKVCNDKTDNF